LTEKFSKGEEVEALNGVKNKWKSSPRPISEFGSIVRSPSGVQSGALAENEFFCIFSLTKHFQSSSGGAMTAPPLMF